MSSYVQLYKHQIKDETSNISTFESASEEKWNEMLFLAQRYELSGSAMIRGIRMNIIECWRGKAPRLYSAIRIGDDLYRVKTVCVETDDFNSYKHAIKKG
jgi:hypothetical protein